MNKGSAVLILLLLPVLAMAQVKRAFNHIEKLKYDQAEELLYRSISKDSLNPGEKYALSILYFTGDYYNHNVDSAHFYIMEALSDFDGSDEKSIEKLQKDEITRDSLINQKILVEEHLFYLIRKTNTEDAYIGYIDKYPTSLLLDSAIWYRNKVAFENASGKNTWQSYESFMKKYPDANQFEEAEERYEQLIFEDKTSDGKLASYVEFLNKFPETFFRKETEKAIFSISTGTHRVEDYVAFIRSYPKSELCKLAAGRLYHILMSKGTSFDPDLLTYFVYPYHDRDSLERLEVLEKRVLFPVLEASKFHILDEYGEWLKEISFSKIPQYYTCGNIIEPLLLIIQNDSSKIVSRFGKIIYADVNIEEVKDLGFGFTTFKQYGKIGLIDYTGNLILPATADEIKILYGQYVAYRINDRWGIASVNQKIIMDPRYSLIEEFLSLIQIHSLKGTFALIKPEDLTPLLDGEKIELDFHYDDVEILPNGLILTYSGDSQGIISSDLAIEVPEEEQELILTEDALIIETDEGFRFISADINILPTLIWEDMDLNNGWITLKGPNGWALISNSEKKIVREYIDSVKLLNRNNALIYKNGERILYFRNGAELKLNNDSQIEVIYSPPSKDFVPTYYTLIKEKNDKWVLNANGDTLLTNSFQDLRAFGNDYLVITERRGSGLLDSSGNRLLNSEFDGIANYKNGSVTLLKDGKLGFYRLSDTTYIPPVFQKSLQSYTDTLFIGYFEDGYGMINSDNKKVIDFDYDEIRYFNDSVAWVKQEENWNLLNILSGDILQKEVVRFYSTEDTSEQFLYFHTLEGKGVLKINSGTIINATFNEVLNVGSFEHPVFKAEKYIIEADYYVLVYFDGKGEILYRQAYPSEEHEKLICDK